MNDKSPGKTKEDKELFELWENEIKIEICRNIASKRLSVWSFLHKFGHKATSWFIRKNCNITKDDRTLEIGCGMCSFTNYLDESLLKNYVGLDISKKLLDMCNPKHIKRIQGDIHNLPFADDTFKHVISIYNFEHLCHLEKALMEIIRVMDNKGVLIFAIPMEDGFLYNLGRNLTSRRLVERKYGVDYMKIIREYEHPNTARTVIDKAGEYFTITDKLYLPFLVPSIDINLLAVYKAVKK